MGVGIAMGGRQKEEEEDVVQIRRKKERKNEIQKGRVEVRERMSRSA